VVLIKVQETPVKRLCKTHNVITVNGQYPGPTLEVREGDTLVINVVNRAQYNVTIHWYGTPFLVPSSFLIRRVLYCLLPLSWLSRLSINACFCSS
jgi:FtsP/CotA-like multicopper oxidase with cupredoxin domain